MKHHIELHIEELVLHGFAHSDRYAVGEAVERELTQLLNKGGMSRPFAKDMHIEHLNSGEFAVSQGAGAETIGTHIAGAIYKGIGT